MGYCNTKRKWHPHRLPDYRPERELNLKIEFHHELPVGIALAGQTYDPEEDDVRSILRDVCQTIGRNGQFIFSGFGQDRWPLDVEYDFLTLVENLPSIRQAVNESKACSIELYEQGVERSIQFIPSGNIYTATCSSGTEWQPNPNSEMIDQAELKSMIDKVEGEFMRAFAIISPELSNHPWVTTWLDSVEN